VVAVSEKVEERIRNLPDRPGIYVFVDQTRAPLYVGKARSLRKRAVTYLSGDQEPRLRVMLSQARDFDFVVTGTEAEALLLENNWIKAKKPRFNVLLRDDKTYPYVKLTGDSYPRVAFTRRIRNDGAQYFGPFLPGGLARKAIKLVQKLFQLRVCAIEIDGGLPRPCLYYDMSRCLGPCVSGLTTEDSYTRAVDDARLFLSGRTDELVSRLRREMNGFAGRLEFEDAARIRDLIAEIVAVSRRSTLSTIGGDDADIFGVSVRGRKAAVAVLVMRGGQVLDRREIFWEGEEAVSGEALLAELLPQFYAATTFIPKEVHLPLPVEGGDALAEWLGDRKGEKVYVRLPARGPKARRIELANRNAVLALGRRFRAAGSLRALEALRSHLDLYDLPVKIEGFDVSNFQGAQTVASLVTCDNGKLLKSGYRSFNIRGQNGPDDVAALREAVLRRYRRRLDEVGEMPDLILVDGGRGQLNAALSALAELGVEETPCAGLAKRQEEVYVADRPVPLRLPRNDPGLQLLQQIRDEAHRFAVSRHRRRRSKQSLRSVLEEIPGVGPKRKRRLLTEFGSLAGLREASFDRVRAVVGPVLAQRILGHLGEAGE
jgi:excinuclease ABC subunit C